MKSRILFVDDEPRVLDALRRMVRGKSAEWDCSFASSAREAWETIFRHEIDAVITDINMPDDSGLDLLKWIRATEQIKALPVIMLTGNAEGAVKQDALEVGATDFLNKPCDFSELSARLASALRLRGYQRELESANEALENKVRQRTQQLAQSRREIVFRLAMAAEARDQTTGAHIVRVGRISHAIASELGYSATEAADLELASTLHDVGKICISDTILLKPDALTEDEFETMRSHARAGHDILAFDPSQFFAGFSDAEVAETPLISLAAEIALSHHERWDGSGYPEGLSGEDIPESARIVAIADAYDAMRSERPYKQQMEHSEVLNIMEQDRGTHFDPRILDAFYGISHTCGSLYETRLAA